MYKLLTTTAVILAVASPSLAWDGAEELAKNLETIYNNLDGQTEFGTLQGTTATGNGQLADFYGTVSQGVAHLRLTTDANNNITATVEPGTTFLDIETKKNSLVNRVNFDLFVQDSASDIEDNKVFNDATPYAVVKYNLTSDPIQETVPSEGSKQSVYSTDHTAGLAGRKIDNLVKDVNTINTFLTAADTTKTLSEKFQTDWGNNEGSVTVGGTTVTLADVQEDITQFNTAINTAKSGSVDGEGYFGNTALSAIDETNINNFIIPNYNDFNSIGDPANSNGYSSISDWANGYETVVAGGVSYRYEGTGEATSDGTTISVDGTVKEPTIANGFSPII